jgi:putative SOS response-associated peptidase YedK
MCGRYFLDVSFDEILSQYDLNRLESAYEERYEIFPTQSVLAIVERKERLKAVCVDWGIKTPYLKRPVINARSEEVFQKKLFATAIIKRRCIIPASGYYEWQNTETAKKIKTKIWVENEALIGLAGVYNVYEINGEKKVMASILTLDAAESIKAIHNRMPLMLTKEMGLAYLRDDKFDLNTYKKHSQSLILLSERLI